MHDAIKGNIRN